MWSLVCHHCTKITRAPGPRFNIKMPSYQYRKSHCGDKTVVRSSYLHNGISYTGKITSLYWISTQVVYHEKEMPLKSRPYLSSKVRQILQDVVDHGKLCRQFNENLYWITGKTYTRMRTCPAFWSVSADGLAPVAASPSAGAVMNSIQFNSIQFNSIVYSDSEDPSIQRKMNMLM